MITLRVRATSPGQEALVRLEPGRYTAGSAASDPLRLAGLPPAALGLDLADGTAVVVARVPARVGGQSLRAHQRRLLRPGERLEVHGWEITLQAPEGGRAAPDRRLRARPAVPGAARPPSGA